MSIRYCVVASVLAGIASVWSAHALPQPILCDVRARTDAGWVCGLRRWAENGATYASFRGVPYAKQPVGELRFKELEPLEPWDDDYDAKEEGPVCFQKDILYGELKQAQSMSEACIYANIHVPYEALPVSGKRQVRQLEPPLPAALEEGTEEPEPKFFPILVFVHGGGFAFGSGDADIYGPEYLVTRGVIVITFNYRLNAFGFLSMNTTKIPGNAGLRDIVTMLRWVQRNARAFGGDPDNVTIGGQSAGATAAHLLTLTKATDGLFKRAILMSGTATSNGYSFSQAFAQLISRQFLTILGITSTDPDEIHQQLIDMPAEKLNEANSILIDQYGLTTFVPVVETRLPGVTPVLEDNPEILIAAGRGKDIPLMIGYTDAECETFRRRLIEFDILDKVKANPSIIVPPRLLFAYPLDTLMDVAKQFDRKYFDGNVTLDSFVTMCSQCNFEYPALNTAIKRSEQDGASVYLYRFTYEGANSVIQEASGFKHKGAGHIEDMTYVFRVNSALGTHASFPPRTEDDRMKHWMTTFFVNFMENSVPVTEYRKVPYWPSVSAGKIIYQTIEAPDEYYQNKLTKNQKELIKFIDSLGAFNGVK